MIIRRSFSTQKKTVDDFSYCINQVRKFDYENFISTSLLRPSSLQRPAMAIRALNVELSLIRDQVSKNEIGRMRLEFWRQTIDSIYSSKTENVERQIQNPVARELNLLIRYNDLTKLWFQRLIKSRETTLNDAPFADVEQLENYLDQSISPSYYLLLELAKLRTLNTDHIGSHLGRAQGLINIIRGIPHNATKRRCFIPLTLIVEEKLSQQDLFNGNFSNESCRKVVHQLANRAFLHLEKVRELLPKDKTHRTIFLPAIVVEDFLQRIQSVDFDLNAKNLHERNPFLVWKLWRQKFSR